MRNFYNRFDMVYAPSQNTVKELYLNGIKKVELWQRGVDLNRFSPNFHDIFLRKKLGDEVLLFGDFNAYTTLVEMDVSEVEPIIKECIDNGYDAVWPGCDLWPEVKAENVKAYVKTIHEFGKKPSPAVGRTDG